jgi:hypothetical protein
MCKLMSSLLIVPPVVELVSIFIQIANIYCESLKNEHLGSTF